MRKWIPVSEKLPKEGQIVRVKARLLNREDIAKFVTTSDGDHFWDNKKNHVWQSSEIILWRAL